MDSGSISLTPAVELSYLKPDEQTNLLDIMQSEGATPSLSQAQRLRRMSEECALSKDDISDMLWEIKGNQVEQVRIPYKHIREHWKRDISPNEMTDIICKTLDFFHNYLVIYQNRLLC